MNEAKFIVWSDVVIDGFKLSVTCREDMDVVNAVVRAKAFAEALKEQGFEPAPERSYGKSGSSFGGGKPRHKQGEVHKITRIVCETNKNGKKLYKLEFDGIQPVQLYIGYMLSDSADHSIKQNLNPFKWVEGKEYQIAGGDFDGLEATLGWKKVDGYDRPFPEVLKVLYNGKKEEKIKQKLGAEPIPAPTDDDLPF